ncbi:hypothetical protein IVB03_25680 [Bradyrhizobium sp. 168]|uniref:hypothetical protein n=1 Tax=unclassified Bradyrhizobium TaxID=2631580 RepID=UPI001FF9F815|nr:MULTISPECIES: hypothetical protein [unclassified Bradyrhizobium]MCK1343289.1 hypothetical protein [Bradyrhizobium sp. CW11]MCK1582854.1 hypothetical protein [Bradyrhizobium sp. 168]MCK1586330.1 hypothetical protein [Bradyrhizobium sp. 169]UPK22605.1 hypothetical protein IVA73_17650 [Bradyrhizobium sp. 131]
MCQLDEGDDDRQTALRSPGYAGKFGKILCKRSVGNRHLHSDCVSSAKPEAVSNVPLAVEFMAGKHSLPHQEGCFIARPDRKPEEASDIG